MTVCAVLAFGIGMILRHTAGAITASTALLFVVPLLVTLLPQAWQNDVNKWVPTYAGDEIFTTRPDPRTRPCRICSRRGGGFAVLAGYAAVALIGGMVAFRRPTREAAPGRSSVGSTRRILMSKQTEQVASLPPLQPSLIRGQAALASVFAFLVFGMIVLCAGLPAHVGLDRRRLAARDAQWRATGPQWTRQR